MFSQGKSRYYHTSRAPNICLLGLGLIAALISLDLAMVFLDRGRDRGADVRLGPPLERTCGGPGLGDE